MFDVISYALSKLNSKDYIDNAISALPKGMIYRGNVATLNDLPLTGNEIGYTYTVSANHSEYIWTIDASEGTIDNWELIGGEALFTFATDEEIQAIIDDSNT